jgi:hypothetical protein
MEDAYILCNMIKTFLTKESNQDREMKAFCSFQVPNDIGIII